MARKKLVHFIDKMDGFTIIELVVSIVIIGILASIAIISYPGIKNQMLVSQINVDLKSAGIKLSNDFSRNGKFPNSLTESDNGKGIKSSSDVNLLYDYNSSTNTYCLQGSSGSFIYHIDSKSKNVSVGECIKEKTFISTWGSGANNYDNGYGITSTSDGGYAVVGQIGFTSDKYAEAIVGKYNSSGELIWIKQIGGPSKTDDRAFAVTESNDGKIIVAGAGYTDNEYGDIFVAVFTQSGDFESIKTIGRSAYDIVRSITKTADGGFLLVGETAGVIGEINYDALFIKLDAALNVTWSKSWGGEGTEESTYAIQSQDNGYVVCGVIGLHGSGQDDSFILKLDSNGNLVWEYRLESNNYGNHNINTITQITDGNFIIGGYSNNTGPVYKSALIAKISAQGSIIWLKTFAFSSENFEINDIIQTHNNSYIVTGSNFIASFSQNGSLYWCKRITGSSINSIDATKIAQLNDGGFALTGPINTSLPSGTDFGIIKFNESGLIINATEIDLSLTITAPTTFGLSKETYSSIKNITQNVSTSTQLMVFDASGSVNKLVLP